ncbi:MAG TPA: hypothetical protein VIV34_09160 [Pseudolabrys sp.]
MPAFLPVILAMSHITLVADTIPKFDVARTCRPAAVAGTMPGREASACQKDENDARSKLEQDWAHYSAAQRTQCASFAALDHAPSYVELLTCLEMAKQAAELPPESKLGTSGSKTGATGGR